MHEVINRVASKPHSCTWCGEKISRHESYMFQKGINEGSWYENKMHPECFDDYRSLKGGDYVPYQQDRPKKGGE